VIPHLGGDWPFLNFILLLGMLLYLVIRPIVTRSRSARKRAALGLKHPAPAGCEDLEKRVEVLEETSMLAFRIADRMGALEESINIKLANCQACLELAALKGGAKAAAEASDSAHSVTLLYETRLNNRMEKLEEKQEMVLARLAEQATSLGILHTRLGEEHVAP
jgi:hypothetical protein